MSRRILDRLFDTRGRPVNPMVIELLELDVRQYRLIQTDAGALRFG